MNYLPLTQEPLKLKRKNMSDVGVNLLSRFVELLNDAMIKAGCDKLWYQPDNTPKWPYRYFWVYLRESQERDFIVRINFTNKDAFQVQLSHFGAKAPQEVDFMSNSLSSQIQHLKGWPPLVKVSSESDCALLAPSIADHFQRIRAHLDSGGTLPLRGTSHLEIAIGNFLRQRDSKSWVRWHKLDFLGQRDLDLALPSQKIAIEIQGDYWHRLPGAKERDQVKKTLLLENGWSLIWAWESCVREQFPNIEGALSQIRLGNRFIELKKN